MKPGDRATVFTVGTNAEHLMRLPGHWLELTVVWRWPFGALLWYPTGVPGRAAPPPGAINRPAF